MPFHHYLTMCDPCLQRQSLVEAGVFLIDKPVGPTSFRIVQQMRKALHLKKVGHAGTLDPFASGLLVLCAGRSATRLIPFIMDGVKEYDATLTLGVETDTGDLEGKVLTEGAVPPLNGEDIEACLSQFRGELLQQPPCFSALKHKGKPLYHYARKGIFIEKAARPVVIHQLECLACQGSTLTVKVRCGKGTYVRSLARDIGRVLGCGAHLSALRRTRSGFFSIDNSMPGSILSDLDLAREFLAGAVLSLETVTKHFQMTANDETYLWTKEVDCDS